MPKTKKNLIIIASVLIALHSLLNLLVSLVYIVDPHFITWQLYSIMDSPDISINTLSIILNIALFFNIILFVVNFLLFIYLFNSTTKKYDATVKYKNTFIVLTIIVFILNGVLPAIFMLISLLITENDYSKTNNFHSLNDLNKMLDEGTITPDEYKEIVLKFNNLK